MADNISKACVIGLGTMGAGIVEVLAAGGLDVVGVEYSQDLLDAGRARLQKSADRAVRRGRLTEEARDALLGRISYTTSFAELADRELVIEAVSERMELKREIFGRLDEVLPAEAVLATNTSSLSVTEIAACTGRPSRVIGMHFFNPAQVQRLVEVIRTVSTATDVVERVTALAVDLGKHPVVVGDRAGFIANALLFGYLNRAIGMYERGHASRADIDAAMQVGCGYPLGPLALLDLIGLDTAYEVLGVMYRETGDQMYVPAPLLSQLVTAGRLGRKTGRGFYSYEAAGSGTVVADEDTPAEADTPPEVTRVGLIGSGDQVKAAGAVLAAASVEVRRDTATADCDLVVAAAAGEPVIKLAVAAGAPAKVVGLNVPVPDGDLVQVVRSVETPEQAVHQAVALCRQAGKTPVVCADRAGRLLDALLLPYLNDAVRMVEAGYASVDDVDAAMRLGCALPKGPFQLIDEIGPETVLSRQWAIYDEVRETGLVPSPLLTEYVTAGRGFHEEAAAE